MRLFASLAVVFQIFAQSVNADDGGAGPSELEGTWTVTFCTDGHKSMKGPKGIGKFTFDGTKVSWRVEQFFLPAGKGMMKHDTSAKPRTIELKSGATVYRGIYQIHMKDEEDDTLDLLLSVEGGEFPKEFGKDPRALPKGFKGVRLSMIKK